MASTTKNHLRLFEQQLDTTVRRTDASVAIHDLCQAFERATGWSLRYVPDQEPPDDHDLLWSATVDPCVGATPGHLRIDLGGPELQEGGPRVDIDTAGELASAVARLLSDLNRTREALRKREAELATNVPVIESTSTSTRPHVAERIEAVLRGGAEAVDCHAAAVYLLDASTTELKLRAAWGLPRERLALPARPLRAALADLEALAGHAVVMKNRSVRSEWHAPEAAAAAVCVPVSSASMPLGTLWMFSAREREFSDAQVNMIEIVAGRLASDLERETLLREGLEAASLKRQVAEAERMQEILLPRVAPRIEPWDVDAWMTHGDRLSGDFYDWFPHGEGGLSLAVGSATGHGVSAAMLAGILRTAVRAHADNAREPQQVLESANRLLWQSAAGLQTASLFYALLDPTGRMRLATAGEIMAMLVRPNGSQMLSGTSLPLARDPETRYQHCTHLWKHDESLIVLTGALDRADARGTALTQESIARLVGAQAGYSAKQLATVLRSQLFAASNSGVARDRTLLIVKRRRPGR